MTFSSTQPGRHSPRRGSTTGGVLAALVAFGTLGATAVMVGPRVLEARAEPGTSRTRAARETEHQQIIELFGSIVARSRGVLWIHPREASPYEELVLWLEDSDHPGRMDADEIGVISHSRILRTLTLFRFEQADLAPAVSEAAWRLPVFCEAWRTNPNVHTSLIATGISDVQFSVEQLIQGEPPALRITFTWASDSADGPDEASILVNAIAHSRTGGAGDTQDAS